MGRELLAVIWQVGALAVDNFVHHASVRVDMRHVRWIGWPPRDALKQKHAVRPIVSCGSVPSPQQYLWRARMRRAHNRVRPASLGERGRALGRIHVCEPDVPTRVNQHVLRLDVSMNHAGFVYRLECQ